MLDRPVGTTGHSPEITVEAIIQIVGERLPHWKVACDNALADTVILQQGAFGRTPDEIGLMHAAIRYAGIIGKTVMIAPYSGAGEPKQ
jgi:hypothetical protein